MNSYTIYCTEAQTKKAFELGAHIERVIFTTNDAYKYTKINEGIYIIPTAEQMIGWLESISAMQLQIEKQTLDLGSDTRYRIWVGNTCKQFSDIIKMGNYSTRKEATLAAIDAALEYLSKIMK